MALEYPQTINDQFLSFGRLPKELRVLIWKAALPDARIIQLNYSSQQGLRARNPPPILRSICQESLEVMTKFYVKAFGTPFQPASTWFDFRRDTLYIDDRIKNLLPQLHFDAAKVQNLAMYAEPDDEDGQVQWGQHVIRLEYWIHKVLRYFKNVQKLTIVEAQYSYFTKEDSNIILMDPYLLVGEQDNPSHDQAENDYDGPCSHFNSSYLARIDVRRAPPINLDKLETYRTIFAEKRRPELNETHFEKLKNILMNSDASPSNLALLDNLRIALTASDSKAWTMPKMINYRIATDEIGMKHIEDRANHMMRYGIISEDRYGYINTEQWILTTSKHN